MKGRLLIALLLILVLGLTVSVASARGHNADQYERAGASCFIAGPHGWTHCFSPGVNPAEPGTSIQVKVFSADRQTFLGTELLLHESVYNGQPCMTDGGEPYHFLGDEMPYYACHHFETH